MMMGSRSTSSGIPRLLVTGSVGGALSFLGLWLLCLLMSSGFSIMGVQASDIGKMVLQEFLGIVIWVQARILITYLVIGGVLGLAGSIVFLGFCAGFPCAPPRWKIVGTGMLTSLVFEFLLLTRAFQRTPQLYADFFYIPGGWRRQAMVSITDRLPEWVILFVLIGLMGICVVSAALLVWRWSSITKQWRGWNHLKSAALIIPFGIIAIIIGGIVLVHPHFAPATQERPAPGIIILGVDSFRWDHISGLGYHRPTTPAIDSLLSRGTVFTRAIIPLPRTFPAWVSYLTGTYPRTHGVRSMFPTMADREKIPPAVPKILSKNGWQCGVISDFAGDIFSRIDLGFQTVQAPDFNFVTLIKLRSLEIHWALMPYINTRIGRKLFPVLREFAQAGYPEYVGHDARHFLKRQAGKGKPFFLTVFFSATHFPYAAPDPFYHQFVNSNYQGDYKYHKPNLLKAHEELSPEDIDHIVGLYDGAVSAVDAEIGKIVKTLEETGLSKSTWVVVTADHGENLYEGEMGMGHGEHLRGLNVLKVPLIIIPPEGKTPPLSQVDVPVSGVDIAPTLLDMAGVLSDVHMEGSSLMPLIQGDNDAMQRFRSRPVFSETGIWFADWTEGFYQHERIHYPDVSRLCTLDRFHDNQIVLKDEARDLIEVAKHRMVLLDSLRLIEIPTREGIAEEAYRLQAGGGESPSNPNSPEVDALRKMLYNFLTTDQTFVTKGEYLVPNGSDWRLTRRMETER